MHRTPEPEPSNDLPRVQVESLHNWQRVRRVFTQNAFDILDEHLSNTKLNDKQREQYAAHIRAFVARTFEIAKPNLRVNGKNYEEYEEELENEGEHGKTEPFDEALDRQIYSLSDQRLRWDSEIAKKRREMPMEVEILMRDIVSRQRAADEDDEQALDDGSCASNKINADPIEPRYPEIESIFNHTAALTDALATSVPIEHERAERVNNVTKEMKSLES